MDTHELLNFTVRSTAVLALVAGCSSDGDKRQPSPTVLVSSITNSSKLGVTSGIISDVGGCLGVEDAVVVWPVGTTVVDSSPLSISIPAKGQFALGDHVELGGGYIHEPPHDTTDKPVEVDGKPIPASCAEHTVFLAGPVRDVN